MAMAEVINLASLPPRLSSHDIALLSSSPQFPSPGALLRGRHQSLTCRQASPTPEHGIAPLRTTAELSATTTGDEKSFANTSPKPVITTPAVKKVPLSSTPRAKTVSEPQKNNADNDGDQPAAKKPRKPRAKKAEVQDGETAVPKQKPPRKPRVKKDNTDGQRKLAKGSVTKASAGSKVEKSTKKRQVEKVSSHFAAGIEDLSGHSEARKASENDLLLQEAVKRRINWTPPKPTVSTLDMTGNLTGSDTLSTRNRLIDDKQKTFLSFLENFGYKTGEMPPLERITNSVSPRKRKLMELMKTNMVAPESPAAKVKASKKKTKTITEQATSAYAAKDAVGSEALQPPLTQHLPHDGGLLIEQGVGLFNGLRVRPRTRSKSSVKGSKAKKGTIAAPILLSPGSALKQVEKQDFVFGTLSQLAKEESPTLLRDLQQAMQASNQIDEDHISDIMEEYSPSKSILNAASGIAPFTAKRNLWAAASRGSDRKSLGIETVDLSESPIIQKSSSAIAPVPALHGTTVEPAGTAENNAWHEPNNEDAPVKIPTDLMELPPSNQESLISLNALQRSGSSEKDDRGRKETSLQTDAVILKPILAPLSRPKDNSSTTMPDFGGYTTAQLAKEIASYRFKPVQNRDRMISLLEKCWQGKQRIALGSKEPNTIAALVTDNRVLLTAKVNTTMTTESATGPSARPRPYSTNSNDSASLEAIKETKKPSELVDEPKTIGSKPLILRQTPQKPKRRTILEEIDDSDTPLTPSPPRRLRLQTHSPPLTLRPSTPASSPVPDDESLLVNPTSQQLLLHQHITRAIHAAPQSIDPTNPSWYEKILLYDPIVLEDLATWLNTGALQRVGWDGEVAPYDVKRWCLANSVCCLWKMNLRGGVRSRY